MLRLDTSRRLIDGNNELIADGILRILRNIVKTWFGQNRGKRDPRHLRSVGERPVETFSLRKIMSR